MPDVRITVDPHDLARIEHKLDTVLKAPVDRLMGDAARFAARETASNAREHSDTTALASSFHADVRGWNAQVRSSSPYALAAEFGRESRALPPLASLRGWAQRHGIPETRLFVLARAIAKGGIKGRFFMKRARARLQMTEFPRLIAVASREIERDWSK